MRTLLSTIAVLLFAAVGHAQEIPKVIGGKFNAAAEKLVDTPAHEFTVKSLDGSTLKLADLKGKVVVLDFFETWCGPCRNMLAAGIIPMHAKYKSQGLEVIGIDRGKRDSQEKVVKEFVGKMKMEFPVAFLQGNVQKEMIDSFKVGPIPHIIVIDRKGMIRQVHVGGNAQALENMIKKLLAEK